MNLIRPRWSTMWVAVGIGCLLVRPNPVRAQSNFELAPFVAYYQPIGSFAPSNASSGRLPGKASDLSGIAWGAEARLGLGRRLGVELQAAVSNASNANRNRVIDPSGFFVPTTQAQILIVTAQAAYDLAPSSAAYRLWVGAGPGLVRHGGTAYSSVGSQVNIGAALSAGLDVPIAPHMGFTLGVESLLYSLDVNVPLDGNSYSVESGLQNDLLFHAGVAWRLR